MLDREVEREGTPLAAERGRSPSGAASGVAPAASPVGAALLADGLPSLVGVERNGLALGQPSATEVASSIEASAPDVASSIEPSAAEAVLPVASQPEAVLPSVSQPEAVLAVASPPAEVEDSCDEGLADEGLCPKQRDGELFPKEPDEAIFAKESDDGDFPKEPFEEPLHQPRLGGRGKPKGRRLVRAEGSGQPPMTPQQRLLILDTWQRSGLPGGDFAALVGVSKHTLYAWKKKFHEQGPAGLMDQPRGGPNALELARHGVPKAPFYVTGRIGDRAFSVHAEGERMILKREGQERTEVDLGVPGALELPLDGADCQAAASLPMPVCPDGSPLAPWPSGNIAGEKTAWLPGRWAVPVTAAIRSCATRRSA